MIFSSMTNLLWFDQMSSSMELFGIVVDDFFVGSLIQFFITLFIGAVLLHVATGILGFEKRGLGTAVGAVFVGSLFSFVLSFAPLIGWILGLIGFWYIIKMFYDIGWMKAIVAWLMSIVVAFLIALVVIFFLGISYLIIPLM